MDLERRGRVGDPQQNKRVRTWAGSVGFNELFRVIFEMRPLCKLRRVSFYISFFFNLKGTANAS